MSSVDIVMTRGVCLIYYVLQMLSKPCLSLSFAFIWKAKCLLLLLPPPCHDQDHLHIAWGWDETPPFFVPLPQLFTWWYEFFLSSRQILFHIVFFPPFIMPSSGLFQLEMVCIVWEVCVFAHLPSYWMLSDDWSRLLDVVLMLSLSTVGCYCTDISIKHIITTCCPTVQP